MATQSRSLHGGAQGAIVAVLAAAVLFGTAGTARELGPDDASSLSVGATRIAIGTAVLWIVVGAERARSAAPARLRVGGARRAALRGALPAAGADPRGGREIPLSRQGAVGAT